MKWEENGLKMGFSLIRPRYEMLTNNYNLLKCALDTSKESLKTTFGIIGMNVLPEIRKFSQKQEPRKY